MAFTTGIHVVCTHVATRGNAALMSNTDWSQTMASEGTTTKSAKDDSSMFLIQAGVDAWVAVGAAPVASATTGDGQSARTLIRAGGEREIYCNNGDKVAWVAA